MDWLDVREFLNDTFQYIIMFILVIITAVYIVSFNQVVGPSMNPTLKDGDITILFKLKYKIFNVKRGDIVSLKTGEERNFAKRIIGLPGEKIHFKDNVLYINDKSYKEEYLPNGVVTNDFSLIDIPYDKKVTNEPYVIIPKGMYLVLGDNRTNSTDSRDIGLVKKEDISGQIVFRIFPFQNIKFVN